MTLSHPTSSWKSPEWWRTWTCYFSSQLRLPACSDSGYSHAEGKEHSELIQHNWVRHGSIYYLWVAITNLSVENTCQVWFGELRRWHAALYVGNVPLKVEQGLAVILHVGVEVVGDVVMLTRAAVPHHNIQDSLEQHLISPRVIIIKRNSRDNLSQLSFYCSP